MYLIQWFGWVSDNRGFITFIVDLVWPCPQRIQLKKCLDLGEWVSDNMGFIRPGAQWRVRPAGGEGWMSCNERSSDKLKKC